MRVERTWVQLVPQERMDIKREMVKVRQAVGLRPGKKINKRSAAVWRNQQMEIVLMVMSDVKYTLDGTSGR